MTAVRLEHYLRASVRDEPEGGLWRDRAACRMVDARRFTPDERPAPAELRELAAVCHTCPVLAECGVASAKARIPGFVAGRWWGSDEYGRRRLTRPSAFAGGRNDE